MNELLENLSWLPKPPDDFNKKLSLASNADDLMLLAKFSLNDSQLNRLAKKLKSIKDNGEDLTPLIPISIGILSNASTDLISPVVIGAALSFGIQLDVFEGEFDQVIQEALSEKSSFDDLSLDSLLIAIDYRGLPLSPSPGDIKSAQKNVQDCIKYLEKISDSMYSKTGSKIILQNFARPIDMLFGSFESRLPGTMSWLVNQININMHSLANAHTSILDIDHLSSTIGLFKWHDPTLWNIGKFPFSQRYSPIYATYICRILASHLGKSRRCLILDLDNTLWGGVIGDDGIDGILLGNGNPTGEAFLNIQQMALELYERGIVLAISSKNEDKNAREPFKKHPDMILREDHIAIFQANWSDKASNIKAIANQLSLGLESLVFLDDNPAERMQVRRELPEVAVPELPDDPALYVQTLIGAGYFEATAFSEEDSQRALFYKGNAKRLEILNLSSDMDSYLESLEMKINFSKFDKVGRSRITQLISKSNQYNLTTKRHDESKVTLLEKDSKYFTCQVRLKDTLGDNGMISVIICKKNNESWLIDTWLMSCRVLGRRVEEAVLHHIISNAVADGASKLIGQYIPSPRNEIVKEHYQKLGFSRVIPQIKNDIEDWELNITNYKTYDLPFMLEDAF